MWFMSEDFRYIAKGCTYDELIGDQMINNGLQGGEGFIWMLLFKKQYVMQVVSYAYAADDLAHEVQKPLLGNSQWHL